MSSSYSSISSSTNYFVWPNMTALDASYQSKDTVDALFITDRSPAYLSSNCSCNGFQTYFTASTPETSFTFGAMGQYSVNGTQAIFDTNIDLYCSKTATGQCILTLHDSDGKGYNKWGTPLVTIGYLDIRFDGNGLERGIGFPIAYSDPKPATYIYYPKPSDETTSSATQSSKSSATSLASSTASTNIQQVTQSSTASAPVSASASSSSAASPQSTQSQSTSNGVVVGVSVGVSFVFLLALLALLLFWRKRKAAKHQDPFVLGPTKRASTHEKLTSQITLNEMHSSASSPAAIPVSPMRMSFIQQAGTPMMTPETLRDFIAAASLDSRTTMDPPARLILPGDEPSALIHNIWDAIAVRETYVSRLNTSITIPSTLESLRKQAADIAYRTRANPPAMLAAVSTPFKGDTIGWSESNRFKHTFAFSGGTLGVPQKRLVVRRNESIDGGQGKKFQTYEKWAVGNCPDCQCFRGASEVVKAFMTVYVADGAEVEACKNCQPLVDSFKKLHSVKAVDESASVNEQEARRAELAKQAVQREWERMESEHKRSGGRGKDWKGTILE